MDELTAGEVMTPNVLVVGADWTLEQLSQFFIDHSISGAPVISEDGKLVGVVSMTDIVRHDSLPVGDAPSHGPHEYYTHGLEREYAPEEIGAFRIEAGAVVMVSDIMTPMIFDVYEDTSMRQVAETMVRGRIHRVFVTREKEVVGTITALDILRRMLEL